MEIVYFVLGMLVVVTLWSVVGVFKIKKDMSIMIEDQVDDMQNDLSGYIEEVHSDLEKEISTFYDQVDSLTDSMYAEDQQILSMIDSRFDKMENKLVNYTDEMYHNHEDNINDLYRYVDSKIETLKGDIAEHIAEINRQLAGK